MVPLLPARLSGCHRSPGRLLTDHHDALRGIVLRAVQGCESTGCSGGAGRLRWREGLASAGLDRAWRLAELWAADLPDRRPAQPSVDRVAEQRKPSRHHAVDALKGCDTRDPRGFVRGLPRRLSADCGYDYNKYSLLWARGITRKIACKGAARGSTQAKTRWVVERTFTWLDQSKRMRIRRQFFRLQSQLISFDCPRWLRQSLSPVFQMQALAFYRKRCGGGKMWARILGGKLHVFALSIYRRL